MKNKLSQLMLTGAFAAMAAALLTHDAFAGGSTIHVPAGHPTIQAAIDAANSGGGDEIIVAPGTYNETINFNGKPVHLRSSDGPEVTIIDATGIGCIACTVVECVSGEGLDTILEGFTITGGTGGLGGGMYIAGSSPTIVNCIFTGNSAEIGGGMFNTQAAPTIVDCLFIGNSSWPGPYLAGGVFNDASSPSLMNCVFIGNSATLGGAMLSMNGSAPVLIDCVFEGNGAGAGGAMYNLDSSPTIISSAFVQNTAWQVTLEDGGGAVYNHGSSPTFTNCQFIENHVEVSFEFTGGGAVRNHLGSSSTFINCTFDGNTSFGSTTSSSGAMFNSVESHVELINCTFTNNQADWDGAMSSEFGSGMTMQDCLFQGNAAVSGGSGAYGHYEGGVAHFTDCHFTTNTAAFGGAGVYMQFGPIDATFLRCNFDNNVADTTATWGGGGARVSAFSGMVTADFIDCTFEGNSASAGGGVHVTDNAQVTISNTSFLQNQAYVFGGALSALTGLQLIVTDSQFVGNQSGIGNGGGVRIDSNASTHFTNCAFIQNISGAAAGGVTVNNGSSAEFTNCLFEANHAAPGFNAGGLQVRLNSTAHVIGSVFRDNVAYNRGGGLVAGLGSTVTVVDSSFEGNHSTGDGGAVTARESSEIMLSSCTLLQNTCAGAGGGVFLDGSSQASFVNCLLANNQAGPGFTGGGLQINNGSFANVVNSTFVNNSAVNGGAIRLGTNGSATVRNVIAWNNAPNQISAAATAGPISVSYSNVQGGFAGAGNINANPLFVDAANGDFRLSAGSPSIDAGDNFAVPDGVKTDLDGNPRFVDDPDTPDTGNGAPGDAIVDMGAYEFQVPSVPSCPGDLTGNNSVGVADLLTLLSCWGPVEPGSECKAADLTANNNVGVADLLDLLSQWGPCP